MTKIQQAKQILRENLNDARYEQENASSDYEEWQAIEKIQYLQHLIMFEKDENKIIKIAGL